MAGGGQPGFGDVAGLLVLMAGALVWSHLGAELAADLDPVPQAIAGLVAGFAIGVVAAVIGVAGGELLIPTIVLLYAVDIKLAGSLSPVVSLPTMLVAFTRYSRDQSFVVLRNNTRFVLTMIAGSITGTLVGAVLLGVIPDTVLIPCLAVLLLVSAARIWKNH